MSLPSFDLIMSGAISEFRDPLFSRIPLNTVQDWFQDRYRFVLSILTGTSLGRSLIIILALETLLRLLFNDKQSSWLYRFHSSSHNL